MEGHLLSLFVGFVISPGRLYCLGKALSHRCVSIQISGKLRLQVVTGCSNGLNWTKCLFSEGLSRLFGRGD